MTGSKVIDGVVMSNFGQDIPMEEVRAYLDRGREKYGERLAGMSLFVSEDEPEMVELHYTLKRQPFERIRRITGYLVGGMDRWNDGKRAEERDRVKHEVRTEMPVPGTEDAP